MNMVRLGNVVINMDQVRHMVIDTKGEGPEEKLIVTISYAPDHELAVETGLSPAALVAWIEDPENVTVIPSAPGE